MQKCGEFRQGNEYISLNLFRPLFSNNTVDVSTGYRRAETGGRGGGGGGGGFHCTTRIDVIICHPFPIATFGFIEELRNKRAHDYIGSSS